MAHVTPEHIETYLADYGWSFAAEEPGEWTTGWRGEHGLFPMTIRLSGTCVSFEVKPLLEVDLSWRQWPELSRELLDLNANLQLVKLGTARDGQIVLACQVLAAGFDFEMFARILGIVGYYADALCEEILPKLAAYGFEPPPLTLS